MTNLNIFDLPDDILNLIFSKLNLSSLNNIKQLISSSNNLNYILDYFNPLCKNKCDTILKKDLLLNLKFKNLDYIDSNENFLIINHPLTHFYYIGRELFNINSNPIFIVDAYYSYKNKKHFKIYDKQNKFEVFDFIIDYNNLDNIPFFIKLLPNNKIIYATKRTINIFDFKKQEFKLLLSIYNNEYFNQIIHNVYNPNILIIEIKSMSRIENIYILDLNDCSYFAFNKYYIHLDKKNILNKLRYPINGNLRTINIDKKSLLLLNFKNYNAKYSIIFDLDTINKQKKIIYKSQYNINKYFINENNIFPLNKRNFDFLNEYIFVKSFNYSNDLYLDIFHKNQNYSIIKSYTNSIIFKNIIDVYIILKFKETNSKILNLCNTIVSKIHIYSQFETITVNIDNLYNYKYTYNNSNIQLNISQNILTDKMYLVLEGLNYGNNNTLNDYDILHLDIQNLVKNTIFK